MSKIQGGTFRPETEQGGSAPHRHGRAMWPLPEMPELRELMIPFGDSGYVALYRHEPSDDAVYVLAFRHQKEAGYG